MTSHQTAAIGEWSNARVAEHGDLLYQLGTLLPFQELSRAILASQTGILEGISIDPAEKSPEDIRRLQAQLERRLVQDTTASTKRVMEFARKQLAADTTNRQDRAEAFSARARFLREEMEHARRFIITTWLDLLLIAYQSETSESRLTLNDRLLPTRRLKSTDDTETQPRPLRRRTDPPEILRNGSNWSRAFNEYIANRCCLRDPHLRAVLVVFEHAIKEHIQSNSLHRMSLGTHQGITLSLMRERDGVYVLEGTPAIPSTTSRPKKLAPHLWVIQTLSCLCDEAELLNREENAHRMSDTQRTRLDTVHNETMLLVSQLIATEVPIDVYKQVEAILRRISLYMPGQNHKDQKMGAWIASTLQKIFSRPET